MKTIRNNICVSAMLFIIFVGFTIMVMTVDVRPIGPDNSSVGLAAVNQFFFERLGVNLFWYDITGWFGILALLVAFGFGLLGVVQLVTRRSLFRVDADILFIGLFYIIVMVVYLFFEIIEINYRPIILNNDLEASFPSTHTLLVLSVLGTAILQFNTRIKNRLIKTVAGLVSMVIIILTIVGRLLSGVHWFTDIVAGVLLGATLIMIYYSAVQWLEYEKKQISRSEGHV